MADINHFDSQPENDFEKISAPGDGFINQEGDGLNAASADKNDPQDGEVSTTTDNNLQGEDEAEEDRYIAMGSSEVDAFAISADPLNSYNDDIEPGMQDEWLGVNIVQPSAPVSDPEKFEPLIDFGSSSVPDTLPSVAPPTSTSSTFPEPTPTTTGSKPRQFVDDFSEFEMQNETRSKQVTEQSYETGETSKGCLLKGLDPRVVDLIYWRDVKKTGVVFGSMLVVLFSLAVFSLVSVLAYLSLAVLTITFSFVVYKKVMGAVQKSNEGHPFKSLLEIDISLSENKLKTVIQALLKNLNKTVSALRRLFLIEDFVDSIKFSLLLWVLTCVGSLMNGMSIIILDVILLFTLPKLHETYQVQIENCLALVKAQINNLLSTVQSKVPFLKKKDKAQ